MSFIIKRLLWGVTAAQIALFKGIYGQDVSADVAPAIYTSFDWRFNNTLYPIIRYSYGNEDLLWSKSR